MRRYKVEVDSITTKGRIYNKGSVIYEDQLLPGLAEALKQKGSLKYLGDNDELGGTEPSVIQKPEVKIVERTIEKIRIEVAPIDKVTRVWIMDRLEDKGIEFSRNASKKELYEILISSP